MPYLRRCRPVAETQEEFILHFWKDTICRYISISILFFQRWFSYNCWGQNPRKSGAVTVNRVRHPRESFWRTSRSLAGDVGILKPTAAWAVRGATSIVVGLRGAMGSDFFFCSQQR